MPDKFFSSVAFSTFEARMSHTQTELNTQYTLRSNHRGDRQKLFFFAHTLVLVFREIFSTLKTQVICNKKGSFVAGLLSKASAAATLISSAGAAIW